MYSKCINPLPHRDRPFNTLPSREDPDQAAVTLFAYVKMIRYDLTIVDLTSTFFVLCTSVKVYLYNYS